MTAPSSPDRPATLAGLSIYLGVATGFLGWISATFSVLDRHDWTGAGVGLVASALSFGLIANALLRR